MVPACDVMESNSEVVAAHYWPLHTKRVPHLEPAATRYGVAKSLALAQGGANLLLNGARLIEASESPLCI